MLFRSPAAFAMTGGKWLTTTIDLSLHYVRPVLPGRITAKAKVINLGARVAFLEGELFDADGKLSVVATASALLTSFERGER